MRHRRLSIVAVIVVALAGCGQSASRLTSGANVPVGASLTDITSSNAVPQADAGDKASPKPPVVVSITKSVRTLPARGGKVDFYIRVAHANKCLFSLHETTPSITPYVKATFVCSSGSVGVRATIPANKSTTRPATWSLSIRAKGPGGLSAIKHSLVTLAKSNNVAPAPTKPAPPPSPPTTQPGGTPPPPPPPPGSTTTTTAGATTTTTAGPTTTTTAGATTTTTLAAASARAFTSTDASRPLPGRNAYSDSGNWSGYAPVSSAASAYAGITAQWEVPTVAPDNTKYLSEWIGIDGAANSNLIQTGTETDGNGSDYAWWEINPQTEPEQIIVFNATGKPVPVAANDFMYSYIEQDSDLPDMWDIHLEDLTQKWIFNRSFFYDGPDTSAEWITEATQVSGQYTYPANFGSMWFDNMSVATNTAGNFEWFVTNYDDSERMVMFPVGAAAEAVTPDEPSLYNGYQYFYNRYTGT